MRIILAVAFSLFATAVQAERCTYVDSMNDRATFDFTTRDLDIVWAPANGAPSIAEHCQTLPVGTGMIQTDAVCGTNAYWFGIGPSYRGGHDLDIMALDGLVWYSHCK